MIPRIPHSGARCLASPSSPSNPPPSSLQPSHYARLELTPGASDHDLRQAFRQLSKRYHPDTTTLPAEQAELAFQRLREAYAVLSDPEQRRRYDALLLQSAAAAAAAGPAAAPGRAPMAAVPRPDAVRRALSGGEWLALLLLGLALVLSLVLGVGLAWLRGAELIQWPSWWPPA